MFKKYAGISVLFLFAALVLLLDAAPATAQEELLERIEKRFIYGFDREFPPFSFELEGRPTGFDVDLIHAVLKDRNVRLVSRPMSWEQLQLALSEGTVHVASGMAKTKQRLLLYDFSDRPTLPLKVKLFTKNKNRVGSLQQFRGRKVAVQKGSYYQRVAENFGGLNIKLYKTEIDGIKALYKDEVDGYAGADKTTYYHLRRLGYRGISAIGTPFTITKLYYAVNKDQTELLQLINQGMREIFENGEYDRIFRKWFVPELTTEERDRMIVSATRSQVNAYAPYTNTPTGAAVLMRSGNIFTGCNVENADSGLSVGALQVAIYNAIAHGESEFKAVVSVWPNGRAIPPKAAERQLLHEFGREILVITEPERGEYVTRMIPDIFPYPYEPMPVEAEF